MKVYFRADGNSQIGLGHIVRCGALAEMIKSDFESILFTRCNIAAIIEEAKQRFSTVIQFEEGIKLEEELNQFAGRLSGEDIVVLDGYQFGEVYHERILAKSVSLVCIDDVHAYSFKSSVIINSAGGIKPSDYSALPQTQFFLGPAYSLLRKPFFEKAAIRKNTPHNKNIFICLGGADPKNATLETLQFVTRLNKFEKYYVVVGGGYLHLQQLQNYINENRPNVSLSTGVSATQLANIMGECAYAVCSPSTVSYEYMTVGGIIYLKQITDNQQDMIRYLVKEGFAFLVGDAGIITEQEEQKSLKKQAAIFDGKAGQRLKSVFEKIALAKKINSRKMERADMMLCYQWANDPAIRAQSFNTNPIVLSDHQAWFETKLSDNQSFYYIFELAGKPFAQVRFQVSNSTAVLSYLVDKNYRNKGLATSILSKGIEAFINEFRNKIEIVGYVKFTNIASQRSFEKLNFYKKEAQEYDASYKYILQYDRNTNWK